MFLIILIGCILFGALINLLVMQMLGLDTGSKLSAGQLRVSLLILHTSSFLLPALLFCWLYFREQTFRFLQVRLSIPLVWTLLSLLMLFLLTPVIQYSYELNQQIPLPSWMTNMESDANATLRQLLKMDDIGVLLANLFLIAVLPALGEELLFRGIVQQYGYKLLKRPELSVWFTAFLFSAIHFQFEGFIPRFLLGLFLGYLFYWTNNLLLPILLHFVNNAGMILVAYSMPEQIEAMEDQVIPDIPVYVVAFSILLMIPIVRYFQQVRKG